MTEPKRLELFPAGIYGMFEGKYRPYRQTLHILGTGAWKSIFTKVKRISKGGPPPRRHIFGFGFKAPDCLVIPTIANSDVIQSIMNIKFRGKKSFSMIYTVSADITIRLLRSVSGAVSDMTSILSFCWIWSLGLRRPENFRLGLRRPKVSPSSPRDRRFHTVQN